MSVTEQPRATGSFAFMLRRYQRTAPWWDDPEQAAVEIGLAAWEARRSYREDSPITERQWVAGQVARRLLDARRSAKRGLASQKAAPPLLCSFEELPEGGELVCSPIPTPELEVVGPINNERVWDALNSLPHKLREPVYRLFWLEEDVPTAAAMLGIHYRTLTRRRDQALRQLRDLLELPHA